MMNIIIEVQETENIGNYNNLYAQVKINGKFFKEVAMEHNNNIKSLMHSVAHSLSEDPGFKLIHDVSGSNSDIDGIISANEESGVCDHSYVNSVIQSNYVRECRRCGHILR